jgi:hypothetical protein
MKLEPQEAEDELTVPMLELWQLINAVRHDFTSPEVETYGLSMSMQPEEKESGLKLFPTMSSSAVTLESKLVGSARLAMTSTYAVGEDAGAAVVVVVVVVGAAVVVVVVVAPQETITLPVPVLTQVPAVRFAPI